LDGNSQFRTFRQCAAQSRRPFSASGLADARRPGHAGRKVCWQSAASPGRIDLVTRFFPGRSSRRSTLVETLASTIDRDSRFTGLVGASSALKPSASYFGLMVIAGIGRADAVERPRRHVWGTTEDAWMSAPGARGRDAVVDPKIVPRLCQLGDRKPDRYSLLFVKRGSSQAKDVVLPHLTGQHNRLFGRPRDAISARTPPVIDHLAGAQSWRQTRLQESLA